MKKDKDKAFELRRLGKTYREIEKQLGISRSTLSGWFSKNEEFARVLEENIKKSTEESTVRINRFNENRGKRLKDRYEQARKEAVLEFKQLKDNPLFFVALALYWGEGDKRSKYNIRISNTEPPLVKIFVLFAEQILKIERSKIKIGLLLYPDLDDNICKRYWAEELGLLGSNFYKSIVIKGRDKGNRLSYGVCSLGFSSIYLKQKILVWIKMIGQNFEDK